VWIRLFCGERNDCRLRPITAHAPRPCPPGDQTDDEKVPQLAPVPNPSKALRVAYRTEEEIHNNFFRILSVEEAKR